MAELPRMRAVDGRCTQCPVSLIEQLYPEIEEQHLLPRGVRRWAGRLAVQTGLVPVPERAGPRCSRYDDCRQAALACISSLLWSHKADDLVTSASDFTASRLSFEEFKELAQALPPRPGSSEESERGYNEFYLKVGAAAFVEAIEKGTIEAEGGGELGAAAVITQPFREWPGCTFVEERRADIEEHREILDRLRKTLFPE